MNERKSKPTTTEERARFREEWTYAGYEHGVPFRLLEDAEAAEANLLALHVELGRVRSVLEKIERFANQERPARWASGRRRSVSMPERRMRDHAALIGLVFYALLIFGLIFYFGNWVSDVWGGEVVQDECRAYHEGDPGVDEVCIEPPSDAVRARCWLDATTDGDRAYAWCKASIVPLDSRP